MFVGPTLAKTGCSYRVTCFCIRRSEVHFKLTLLLVAFVWCEIEYQTYSGIILCYRQVYIYLPLFFILSFFDIYLFIFSSFHSTFCTCLSSILLRVFLDFFTNLTQNLLIFKIQNLATRGRINIVKEIR